MESELQCKAVLHDSQMLVFCLELVSYFSTQKRLLSQSHLVKFSVTIQSSVWPNSNLHSAENFGSFSALILKTKMASLVWGK